MTDPKAPDPAEQLCIGPEGHVPPEAHGEALSAMVPGFLDVRMIARAAGVGEPCTGLYSTVTHEWGATGTGPHLGVFIVTFDPSRPQAPRAYVAGTPTAPGEITRLGHDGEGLSLPDRQRLVDAYQSVLAGAVGPLRPGWREPWDWPRADYVATWRRIRPRWTTRRTVMKAITEACGVSTKTIRRWHENYAYPLYETVAEYDRKTGTH